MTNFEKQLKQSLEAFQPNVSNQHKSWESVQNKLRAQKRKKYFIAAGIAAIAFIATTIALLPNQEIIKPIIEPTKQVQPEKNIIDTAKPESTPEVKSLQKNKTQKAKEEVIKDQNNNDESELATESIIIPDTIIDKEPNIDLAIDKVKPESKDFTESFEAKVSVENPSVCFGEKLNFKLNTKEPVSVVWHFSDGQNSEEPNPSILINKAGTYTAYVELTSLMSSKVQRFYIDSKIKVFPKKEFDIEVSELSSDNFERKYRLDIVGADVTSVNWIGHKTRNPELLLELNERGNYQYTAEVFDVNGCKYVLSKNFDVETDNNLLAPTAFTPNGDGVNDDFLPEALNTLPAGKFVLQIINPSSGRMLFETSNPNNRWNGINPETGKAMQTGTYIWTAKVAGKQGSKTFTGKISIVD